MLPIPDPVNQRLIYTGLEPGRERQLYRKGDLVYKIDNIVLGEAWQLKMKEIIYYWHIPGFVDFIPNGYVTRYVNGHDLHGNIPFSYTLPGDRAAVSITQRMQVLEIFADAIRIGNIIGFTLGDITCGNIISDGNQCFLIDYDSIVDYPTPHPQVWENTLRLVFS